MWLAVRRAALLVALSLLAAPALAEDPPDPGTNDADSPVSIGSRRPQPVFSAPREVELYTVDGMAPTATLLLDGLRGLSLFESLALGGTPGVRGLIGRRMAVLVDGLRLENSLTPIGGDDLLGLLDPLAIRQVELLHGPGSVAQGSGAIGGAILLRREHLVPEPRRAWDAHAHLKAGFDSGRLGPFARVDGNAQLRGVGIQASAGLRRFADLQAGRGAGRQEFTGGSAANVDVEAAWAPRRGSVLRAAYELLRQPDAGRADRSVWDDFLLVDRDRDVVLVSYSAEELGPMSGLEATVRYRHDRTARDLFHLEEDVVLQTRERVAALDARVAMSSDYSTHRLSYGVDFSHDWVASSRVLEGISNGVRARGASTAHPDGSRALEVEAFAMDQVAIGSRFAVELGARLGAVNLAPGPRLNPPAPGLERTMVSYASTAHARFLLGDGLNVVAGLGQGFLAPNLDDVAGSGCHERGYRLPSPKLQPEKSLTGELGVKLDLYGVLTGSIFYAYTQLFDAMVEAELELARSDCGGPQPAPVLSLENSSARVHSVEAALQLEFSRWKLISWLAWSYGTSEVAGYGSVPMDRVPPLSGYALGRYQFGWARSYVELALRWAAPQDQLGPADRLDPRFCSSATSCPGSESFFYLSLRGGLQLLRPLQISVALENLTHERYRSFGSAMLAPGFSALVGVEVTAR